MHRYLVDVALRLLNPGPRLHWRFDGGQNRSWFFAMCPAKVATDKVYRCMAMYRASYPLVVDESDPDPTCYAPSRYLGTSLTVHAASPREYSEPSVITQIFNVKHKILLTFHV